MHIQILNQGYGNSKSLSIALQKIKHNLEIEHLAHVPKKTTKHPDFLFLPGVGNFGHAMRTLRAGGWDDYIQLLIEKGVTVVGICLGLQLFADSSEEAPGVQGLGLISGHVRKLEANLSRVPNTGWRSIVEIQKSADIPWDFTKRTFYFTHSYYLDVRDKEFVRATSYHGDKEFPAMIYKDNIIATQFHIEKSGHDGLELLRWIIEK